MKTISGEEATQILRRTGRLENVHVAGPLYMYGVADLLGKLRIEVVQKPILLKNCRIEDYYSLGLLYRREVVWEKCTFERVRISAAYFNGGLVVKDCEILSEIDYGAAGHNFEDTPFLFERTEFHKFVDFFDCWFRGPVILRDVEFKEGTNLMHKDAGWVRFDVPPVLERVTGQVDCPYNLEYGDGETRLIHWRDGHGAKAISNKMIPRTRYVSYAILVASIALGFLAAWRFGAIGFFVIAIPGYAIWAYGLTILHFRPNVPTFVCLGKTRLGIQFPNGKDRFIQKENIAEVRNLARSRHGCLIALDSGEEVVLRSIERDVVQEIREWAF